MNEFDELKQELKKNLIYDETIEAVKLEPGPVQTLAHQESDGAWVLNDPPPNKALELEKCQIYDEPIEPEFEPEIELPHNRHYIEVDDRGRIVGGWSDGIFPDRDTTNAICIDEEGEYQFQLMVLHEEDEGGWIDAWHTREQNPPLFDMDGIPLYEYQDGEVLERTPGEIEADRAAIPEPPPSAQERMEAQVTYTAMMTDTLLEEG